VHASMNTLLATERRAEWGKFHSGQMFEQGSHLMDLMVRLMGRPSKVTPYRRKQGNDTLADNTLAVLEWPRALGVVEAATLQPNSSSYRRFEIFGTEGAALVQPLEPPALRMDLAKPAGPYKARRQQIALPGYRRYVDDLVELAGCIRGGKPLSTTPAQELTIQDTLLRACEM
jgi:predicted dehydrogenase